MTTVAPPKLKGIGATDVHAGLIELHSFAVHLYSDDSDEHLSALIPVFISSHMTSIVIMLHDHIVREKFTPKIQPGQAPPAQGAQPAPQAQPPASSQVPSPPPPGRKWLKIAPNHADWNSPGGRSVLLDFIRHVAAGGGDPITLERAATLMHPGLVISGLATFPQDLYAYCGRITLLSQTHADLDRLVREASTSRRRDFFLAVLGPAHTVVFNLLFDDHSVPGNIHDFVQLILNQSTALKLVHAATHHAQALPHPVPTTVPPSAASTARHAAQQRRARGDAARAETKSAVANVPVADAIVTPNQRNDAPFCRGCQATHAYGAHTLSEEARQHNLNILRSRQPHEQLIRPGVTTTATPTPEPTLAPTPTVSP